MNANDFIHLVGYASGLELITALDYSLNNDIYSIVNLSDLSLPKIEDLFISPFCGLKSAFELPTVALAEISIIGPETLEPLAPNPKEENLTLLAALDKNPPIQEATLPIQNDVNHSDLVKNIPTIETEISFSLAPEPAVHPSNNKSIKANKHSNPKKRKSKESST